MWKSTKVCTAKNVYFVIQITKQSAFCCKFCSGRRSSANIVGLYMNFSGPNNFQSLQLMFWDSYSSMKFLSEASWSSLLAPKLLNCVCFIHLCISKSHVFSVLLHYDKHLSYTTHLLWHIWSEEKEHCRRLLQKGGLSLQAPWLCLDVMLEENERAYSLDTALAHCMGKQVTYKESPSCICHGNISVAGKRILHILPTGTVPEDKPIGDLFGHGQLRSVLC